VFVYSCQTVAEKVVIVVIGIFVDDLFVTGNPVDEIKLRKLKNGTTRDFCYQIKENLSIVWVWKSPELMETHCCFIRRPMLRKFSRGSI
jgi:hypothetical protein